MTVSLKVCAKVEKMEFSADNEKVEMWEVSWVAVLDVV